MLQRLSENGWFILSLPAELRALVVVRRTVEAIAQQAGLTPCAVHEVTLALCEACTNVIVHGYGGKQGQRLTVACRQEDSGLEVRLYDEAKPFDIRDVPVLPADAPRAGGRGVFLIRQLMDEATSRRLDEGGNELRMFKRRAAKQGASPEQRESP